MFETLHILCEMDGVSGDEGNVRDYIISCIDGYCDLKTDALGNIIAFKAGAKRPQKTVMLDAHTDEVGLIITAVTPEGYLKFQTVGGINPAVLISRRVRIGDNYGVIGCKPIHLCKGDDAKKLPKIEQLYIDIGARNRNEALDIAAPGDRAALCSEWVSADGKIKCKAIDDRVGCAILISLLQEESEYDFYATFTVQEEVGLRGAKTATYTVDPDSAIVIEATTASDIADVEGEKRVCILGKGAAVSFMDNATLYDRDYFNAAMNSGIPCQAKTAVAGGNNSGSVHLSRGGVRTIAVSVPCRYIHSASCVADRGDIEAVRQLVRYMRDGICSGSIK